VSWIRCPGPQWLTWGFQVIPVFFLIGGYANTVSWRSHRDRGGDWGSWLYRRTLRLLWPTAIFVAVAALATVVAAVLGTPVGLLRQAATAVSIILWFLAVYLVAALTPLAVSVHDRWRLAFVATLAVMVVLIDAVRFLADAETVGWANYALVWGVFHQLGVAWRDGQITTGARPWLIAVSGAAGLTAAVSWGPYPVSMVTVTGAEVQNTGPPTLALLLFGMAQIGIVLLLGRPPSRWLHRPGVWTAVVAGSFMVMSAFLGTYSPS
jgi:hypothetical protein